MPRYVIEVGEPIEQCWQCPCYYETEGMGVDSCQVLNRPHPNVDELDNSIRPRPSWCPLQPLDDSSLEKHADATLTSVQHFINDSGPFPVEWDFATIRCHGCGETFVALVAGRSRFCPRCGAKLNVTHTSEVKHPSYTLVSVDGERRAQELKEFREQLGV